MYSKLTAALVCATLCSFSAQASEGVVIAHIDSYSNFAQPADAMKELRLLYLKRKMSWPNGKRAKAYALATGHDVETSFALEVLLLEPAQLDLHWRRAQHTDGTLPPIKVRSERLLSKMVAKIPNSFGVISKEYWTKISKDNPSLKVLLEF
jgi:hypothetical protein